MNSGPVILGIDHKKTLNTAWSILKWIEVYTNYLYVIKADFKIIVIIYLIIYFFILIERSINKNLL